MLVPRRLDCAPGQPTAPARGAHRARLLVHGWTLRAENQFLRTTMRIGDDPDGLGDVTTEVELFYNLGLDVAFGDFPDAAVAVRAGRPRSRRAWHPSRTQRWNSRSNTEINIESTNETSSIDVIGTYTCTFSLPKRRSPGSRPSQESAPLHASRPNTTTRMPKATSAGPQLRSMPAIVPRR